MFGNRLLAAELSLGSKAAERIETDLIGACMPAPGERQTLVGRSNWQTVDIAPACRLLPQMGSRRPRVRGQLQQADDA